MFHLVLTPFSAPSNVKVGLDYIMKNADNEARAPLNITTASLNSFVPSGQPRRRKSWRFFRRPRMQVLNSTPFAKASASSSSNAQAAPPPPFLPSAAASPNSKPPSTNPWNTRNKSVRSLPFVRDALQCGHVLSQVNAGTIAPDARVGRALSAALQSMPHVSPDRFKVISAGSFFNR